MTTQPPDDETLRQVLAATNGNVAPGATTSSNLPDMVANNPSAYSQLVGYDYKDPLAYYDTFSGGPARGLGSSNGLVIYSGPNKKEGATAAVLADIANRQQQKRFEETLSGRQGGRPQSNLGTAGDLGGGVVDYISALVRAARIGGQAGAAKARGTTPATESGAGRLGGGGGALPSAGTGTGGGGVDWSRILGAVLGSQR